MNDEYDDGNQIPDYVLEMARDDASEDKLIALLLDFPDNSCGS